MRDVRSSWVQFIGPPGTFGGMLDFETANRQQHLGPETGEVLLLPLDVVNYLLANHPSQWQPQTIAPNVTTISVDTPSGLDVTDVAAPVVWGLDDQGPYWDDEGVDGADVAHLTYPAGDVWLEGNFKTAEALPKLLPKLGAPVPDSSNAGVQWLAGPDTMLDFETANRQQHLNPQAGEVLLLHYDVVTWLIQNDPTHWQPVSVSPSSVLYSVDPTTGYDLFSVGEAGPVIWGVDSQGVYWDDTGSDGADVAHIFVLLDGTIWVEGNFGASEARPKLFKIPRHVRDLLDREERLSNYIADHMSEVIIKTDRFGSALIQLAHAPQNFKLQFNQPGQLVPLDGSALQLTKARPLSNVVISHD